MRLWWHRFPFVIWPLNYLTPCPRPSSKINTFHMQSGIRWWDNATSHILRSSIPTLLCTMHGLISTSYSLSLLCLTLMHWDRPTLWQRKTILEACLFSCSVIVPKSVLVIGLQDRRWPMTEGQLASRTNDPLVAGGKGPTTDADFGTIISAYMSNNMNLH